MRASTREGLGRALLVIGSVAVAGVGLEAAARVARRFRGPGYEAAEASRYMEYDPLLGWHKRPNSAVTYRRREYTVENAINRHGLRELDRDYAPPAGCERVLALGDSFVEGYTVPFEQTVGHVLETALRAEGRRVEVLNGGTSGYSTDQEYLFYRTEGVRYSPRVVLVFFYYNDVLYNARDRFAQQPKPLLSAHEGRLDPVNAPVPRPLPAGHVPKPPAPHGSALLEWLHDRLFYGAPRAYQALARLRLWDAIAETHAPMEIRVYERHPPAEIEAAWERTSAILGALAQEAAGHDARLLLVYIPNRFEVDPHTWELTRIIYGVDESVWDRAAVCRRLERIGAQRGFPVLDLTPALRQEVHWPWRGPYFDYDGHWTAAGHRAAAGAVRSFLQRTGWLGFG